MTTENTSGVVGGLGATRTGTVFGGGVYVELPEMAISFARGLILQMWVRPDVLQDAELFNLGDSIRLIARTNGVEFRAGGDNAACLLSLRVGAWNHLTVVLDPSGATFYLDGAYMGVGGMRLPPEAARAKNVIGIASDRTTGGFRGAIADVRLWNRSSGLAVVLDRRLRDLRGDEPGLVGHWTLEGATGVRDSSSFGRDGVLRGGAFKASASSFTISPAIARCLDLKGEGVVVIDAAPAVSRSFTWQAQVLVRDLTQVSDLFRVNGLLISTNGGVIHVTASGRKYRSSTLLTANTWASLAVRIGDDGKVNLFAAGAAVSLTDLGVASAIVGCASVRLGEKLDGQLAEVRLWTRALTSAEIADTSARRIHGWAPGLLGCWRLDEEIEDTSALRAMIFADSDFKGQSQSLGVGRYDWSALTIGNDTLSSLRVQPGLRVTLYEHGGFAGASVAYTSDASLVGKNDQTSSIVVEERSPPQATIFADANYAGWSQRLGVGRYDDSALTIGNDALSSLKVPAGLKVTLYEHGGYAGTRWVFYADEALVGNNDKTSSIVVERGRELVNADPSGPAAWSFLASPASSTLALANAPRVAPPRVAGLGGAIEMPTVEAIGGGGFTVQMWVNLDPLAGDATLFQLDGFATLYPDANFAGTPQVLRRGSHDVGALTVGNDKLSSIRVSSGTRATLYKDGGFKGDSYGVDEDLATLTWFDNLASSIKVEGRPAVELLARNDGDALGLTVKLTGAGNDQASSIRVESIPLQATIYADKDFNGACQDLGVGRYDVGALVIGDNKLSSLRVPSGLKVTLYEDPGFKGASRVYTADKGLVDNNDRTSSIVVEESDPLQATIYKDSSFAGASQTLGVGRYDMGSLTIGNDALSSLRVPPGLKVTLYEDAGFTGASRVYYADKSLVDNNDRTSSIVVERYDARRVTIYADADFTGASQSLAIGSHDIGALTIGNDKLSSLKVPEGLKVTLFEHAGFTGKSRVFTADTGLVGTETIELERVFTARRWTHLTITQDADGIFCVYVGGRLVRREEMMPLPPQALIPRIGPFTGSVTEVRLWPHALTPEEVEATWQRRAAGAPAARWALHGDLKGTVGDASGTVTWREAPSLVVKDPGAPVLPTVRGRASLMADPTGKGGKPQLCVDFTASDASGRPVPGVELTVEPGAAIKVYRKYVDDLGKNLISYTTQFKLTADSRGKARVVLVPESLQLPIFKVRHAGMGEGEWALVTPDQIIFDTLASLTTSELRGGRRAGTTTAAGTAGLITNGEEHLVELLRGMFSAAVSTFSFEAESTAALAFGDLEDEAGTSLPVVGENIVQVTEGTALVRRLVPRGTAFVVAADDDEMATAFFGQRLRKAWKLTVKFVTNTVQAVTDVVETVESVARSIAAPVIEAISAAVDVVINGIAVAKEWAIQTVEDIVNIAVDIFKTVGKAVGDVLGYLAEVFDWGDILTTAEMMLGEVQRAIATSKTGVNKIFDTITTSIRDVESKVLELLGGSGAAALPAPTRPAEASPDAVLPETPSLLELLLSLLPDDLAQTIRDIEAVFDPMENLFSNSLGKLSSLSDGLSAEWNDPELQAAFADPKRFIDGDPAEWKALARLLVKLIANGTVFAVDFVRDLANAILESIKRLVDLRLNIPVLTPWVEKHVLGGAQLTVGRMCCLVVAIPLTATYKVLTGSKSGPAELMDGPQNFADSGPKFAWTLTQRGLDIVGSTVGAGVDIYESGKADDAGEPAKVTKIVFDCVNWVLTAAGMVVDLADDEDWEGPDWWKFGFDLASAALGLASLAGGIINMRKENKVADYVDGICGAIGDGCGVVSGVIDVCLTATDDETSRREVAVSSLDLAASVGSFVASVAGAVPKETAKDPFWKGVRTLCIIVGNGGSVLCKTAALGVYIRDSRQS